MAYLKIIIGCFVLILCSGCADLLGDQEAQTRFLVHPEPGKEFAGWSEITLSDSADSADYAELVSVSLSLEDPNAAADLSFIAELYGKAVTSETQTRVVQSGALAPNEDPAALDIVYHDDLRPFFEDGYTIHIDWNGKTADVFPPVSEDGVWVIVNTVVHIE